MWAFSVPFRHSNDSNGIISDKKMRCILLIFLFNLGVACAEPDYGFKDKRILTKGYCFRFLGLKKDQNKREMGVFLFRWDGDKAVKLYGYGFEKDGTFQVRFEQVSRWRTGKWLELPILSCGTGAETFHFRPGKEYRIWVPMWRFSKDLKYQPDPVRKGDKGVVKIVGEGVSLLSEPFDLHDAVGKREGEKKE